jgi:hypothetical protein
MRVGNVSSFDGQGGRAARTRCPSGALTVAEMQRLIEAEFARSEPRPASRPGLLPLGQLELARQRLMERLPRLVALTGRGVAAAFEGRRSEVAAI